MEFRSILIADTTREERESTHCKQADIPEIMTFCGQNRKLFAKIRLRRTRRPASWPPGQKNGHMRITKKTESDNIAHSQNK